MQFAKKIILFSVIVIVSSAVIFMGWIWYSFFRPLNTKDWSTYSSRVYNYSIKFPNDWETFGYGADPQDNPQPGGSTQNYQERHFKNPKNVSEELLLKVWSINPERQVMFENTIKTVPFKNKRTEEILVDGMKALKVTGDPPPYAAIPVDQTNKCNKWIYLLLGKLHKEYLCLSNRQAIVTFSKDKYIYILQTEGLSFKTFDAMLTSFKFL